MAGAGQGNARCAECHFRSHGPSDAPGGSCTLTCHGKDHQGVRYSNG